MPDFETLMKQIETDAKGLVWWSADQIARGEDVVNDPKKGERPWIVPETTGRFLHDMIIKNNFVSVLELGTSIGYSTLWSADAVIKNSQSSGMQGSIHTIEHSPHKIEIAKKYFKEADYEQLITVHNGEILDVLRKLDADLQFDFVFMDADRGHYHEYFPLIKKHLLPGAIIVADNAGNMNTRMQPFFELLRQENIYYEILDFDNGLLVTDPVPRYNN